MLGKTRKWDRLDLSWLRPGEVQADPLSDLAVKNGVLSIWHIEPDQSNLKSIIVAMAINRDTLQEFSYGLFDQGIINDLHLRIESNPGTTPIDFVNNWHRDIVDLTTDKAARFVRTIFYRMERPAVLLVEDLVEMIREMIDKEQLEYSTLKKSIKKEFDKVKNAN